MLQVPFDNAFPVLQRFLVRLFGQYQSYLSQVLVFGVAFVVAVAVGRLVVIPVVERLLATQRITPTIRQPAARAVRAGVYLLAFFVALSAAGLRSLLTVTGGFAAALTLAVGFASRDVLGNLVGGLFIITDPKFNIGDWIEWGSSVSTDADSETEGITEGVIEDISFRATRVRTFRNELITVPNSTLATAVVTNHDIKERLRIDYPFGVEYGGDIDAMRAALLDEAEKNPRILARPEPTVIVDGVTAAGVDLVVRFWISNPNRQEYLAVRSAYFQAVKERFEQDGFELSADLLELTGDVGGGPTAGRNQPGTRN